MRRHNSRKLYVSWMLFFSLILGIPSAVFAADAPKKLDTVYGSDLPILKNHMIEIKSYDAASETFEVFAPEFPGEGNSRVTLEGLKKAVGTIDTKRIKEAPNSILTNQYKAENNLPTLSDKEVAARKKALSHKSK